MVLFISVRGAGKSEINYKEKKKIFSSFRECFLTVLFISLPEKMIRKCFGGKEKE